MIVKGGGAPHRQSLLKGVGMDSWITHLIVSGIVGVGVWYFQHNVESIRRERERLQESRRKIYLDLLSPFISLLSNTDDSGEKKEAMSKIISTEYRRTVYEIGLFGSDDVVLSFNEILQYFFKLERSGESAEAGVVMKHWGSLLLAIRRDLGAKGTKLVDKDMLRSHIKDIDEVM